MNTYPQAGSRPPQVGVVELPDLAEILSNAGVGVVTGSTFRESAAAIKEASAGGPLPLIAGDRPTSADGRPTPGYRVWIGKAAAASTVAVIRNGDDLLIPEGAVAEVPYPTTVNTILAAVGLPPLGSDIAYPASGAPAAQPSPDAFFSEPTPTPAPAQPAPDEDMFGALSAPAAPVQDVFAAPPVQAQPAQPQSQDPFYSVPGVQAPVPAAQPQQPAAETADDDFYSSPSPQQLQSPAPQQVQQFQAPAAPAPAQDAFYSAPAAAAPQSQDPFYSAPVAAAPQAQQFQAPAPQQDAFYSAPAAAVPQEAPVQQSQDPFYSAPVPQQAQQFQAPAPQQDAFYSAPAAAAPQSQDPFYSAPAAAAPQAQQFQAPVPQQDDFYSAPAAPAAAAPQSQDPFYSTPAPQQAQQFQAPAQDAFYSAPAAAAPQSQDPFYSAPAAQQFQAPAPQQTQQFQAPARDAFYSAPAAPAQFQDPAPAQDAFYSAPAPQQAQQFQAPPAQDFYGAPAQQQAAPVQPAQDFYGAPTPPQAQQFQTPPAQDFYGAPAQQQTAPVQPVQPSQDFYGAPASPGYAQDQGYGTEQSPQGRHTQLNAAPMDMPAGVTEAFDSLESSRRRAAGRSDTGLANMICVLAGKGGVGKTTTSLALAQTAAEAGLKVILIDGNMGQADLRTYLRIHNSDLPTIYDAAIDQGSAILSPAQVNSVREPGQGKVSFGFVAGQPHTEGVDQHVVTNTTYSRVIHEARRKADLVILDTQIVEATDRNGFVRDIIQPLLVENAFALALSNMTTAGVDRLNERLLHLINNGVPRDRIMVMLNDVDPDQMAVADSGARYFGNLGSFIGAVPTNIPEIKEQMNTGRLPSDNLALRAVLAAALERVTGSDIFSVPVQETEPQEAKSGVFGRMFGRKGKAA